ncbi:hypothetical protein BDV18DRAFT_131068 [Aspergillus unguis]
MAAQLGHDDYTIAWICSQRLDFISAKGLLDETHPNLHPHPNDGGNLQYRLGRKGVHNIVIVKAQNYIDGAPPTRAIAGMLATFPSIRLTLMVSFAAGAPQSVRLGDVVVGMPKGEYGAVMSLGLEWDLEGRRIPNQGTCGRNCPPIEIGDVLTQLEAEDSKRHARMQQSLKNLEGRLSRYTTYVERKALRDVLFQPDCTHVMGSSTETAHAEGSAEEEREDPCMHCDQTKIIQREPRDMKVHYGLVLFSAPVEDGLTRDRVNQQFGNKVLCFDIDRPAVMLASELPSVVIRGICGYTDSHDNMAWQTHAAAAAAAYAGELLSCMPAAKVNLMPKVKAEYPSLQCIQDWFYLPISSNKLASTRSQKPLDTWGWVARTTEFKHWLKEPSQTLLYLCRPGVDKTTVACYVVDHLLETFRDGPSAGVAFLSCFFYRGVGRDPVDMISSLLRDLIHNVRPMPSAVRDLYMNHAPKRTYPSLDELRGVMYQVTALYQRTLIVVDGLDDLFVFNGDRDVFLLELLDLQTKTNANLFITSRPLPDIETIFGGMPTVKIDADNAVAILQKFVHAELQGYPSVISLDKAHLEEIENTIVTKADTFYRQEIDQFIDNDVFLLGRLHIETVTAQIDGKTDRGTIRQVLDTLPPSMDGVYDQAIQRIRKGQQQHKELAMKFLPFIASARRPVAFVEAQSVLATRKDTDIKLIASVCRPFVIVDEKRGSIRLVHPSAKEFIDMTRERWFPRTDVDEDVISDISAEDSEWSDRSTGDSRSSFGGWPIYREASRKLTLALCADKDLGRLYEEAVAALGRERFSKNHDNILKRFFKSLREEVDQNIHLQTIRLLRYSPSRRQVTETIHRLCMPSPGSEIPQELLDQKESRDELLERYLETLELDPIEETSSKDPGRDEPSSDSEAESSADEDEDGMGSLPKPDHLDAIVSFLTSGPSYEALKRSMHLLAHPPTSIPEAVQLGGVKSLKKLFEKRFNEVATGEYAWIKELDEVGYSYYEIADLICQEQSDAPWIYFDPDPASKVYPKEGSHVQGCAHSYFSIPRNGSQEQPPYPEASTVTELLEELCGLAGIVPSRNVDEWNGVVTFEEQNSVATVSFKKLTEDGRLDCQRVLESIITVLDRVCAAAGLMQANSLCCDSFTIVVHGNKDSQTSKREEVDQEPTSVRLCRIKFAAVLELLTELKSLPSCPNLTSSLAIVMSHLCRLLNPLFDSHQEILESDTVSGCLNTISLTAQFLSLGVLSYNQGHVGPIRPFFLDTPQRRVLLAGNKAGESTFGIIAELTNMTCVGDMIQGQVMSFRIAQLVAAPCLAEENPFDLLSSAEDLLDTWGPGGYIMHRDKASPCAIKIRGGIICANENSPKYHWSPVSTIQKPPAFFNPQSKICIGSLVAVNPDCSIDEQECWEKSNCALTNLGVQSDFWRYDETQIGGQAGEYFLLQAHITRHRVQGTTLKQVILEWEPEMLIPALNCLWGLQVSFCTGVTKRVPLRELMADLLPTFARVFARQQALWDELVDRYYILEAFRADTLGDWFAQIPPEMYSHVICLVRSILSALKSTGIDSAGNYLSVAWPYDNPPFRCFRISCNDKANSWTRVLADSEDCATFAYISSKCLVTASLNCQGPSPSWRSTTPLLGTAIIRYSNGPVDASDPLPIKGKYFFKKPDSLLRVALEQTQGALTLCVAPSSVPERMRQRLRRYGPSVGRDRWIQLRERQQLSERAEHVAVLTWGAQG